MSGEVTPASVSEVRPYDRFITYLTQRAELETADFSDVAAQQVENILTAETADALFDAMALAGLQGLRDVAEGTAITIHNFRFISGALGIGVYAVIDATDTNTGEGLALNTGVERVLAFLRMAETMDLFPVDVIVHHKTTGSGNELTTLGRPARKPVKGKTATAE
jgi:hypothetical protein